MEEQTETLLSNMHILLNMLELELLTRMPAGASQ